MLGKIKTMITSQYVKVLNYFPLKGCALNITGAAASNPTIDSSYNIASVVRSGVGTYVVTLSQPTIYGIDVAANSALSLTWNIEPIVTSALFKVDASLSSGVITIYVYQITISGLINVRALVDILSTDKISLSLIMSGGAALPPE